MQRKSSSLKGSNCGLEKYFPFLDSLRPPDPESHQLDLELEPLDQESESLDVELEPPDQESESLDVELEPPDQESESLDVELEPRDPNTVDKQLSPAESECGPLEPEYGPLDPEMHPLYTPLRYVEMPLRPVDMPNPIAESPTCDFLWVNSIYAAQVRGRSCRRTPGGGDADRSQSLPPTSLLGNYVTCGISPSFIKDLRVKVRQQTSRKTGAVPKVRSKITPRCDTSDQYSTCGSVRAPSLDRSGYRSNASSRYQEPENAMSAQEARTLSKRQCHFEEQANLEKQTPSRYTLHKDYGCRCRTCGGFMKFEVPAPIEKRHAMAQTTTMTLQLSPSAENYAKNIQQNVSFNILAPLAKWMHRAQANLLRHEMVLREDLDYLPVVLTKMYQSTITGSNK